MAIVLLNPGANEPTRRNKIDSFFNYLVVDRNGKQTPKGEHSTAGYRCWRPLYSCRPMVHRIRISGGGKKLYTRQEKLILEMQFFHDLYNRNIRYYGKRNKNMI